MPVNIKKGDLRNIKTKKALNTAIFSLLEKYNFRKISVKDICEEALVCRATFYTYFIDKYDFLKYWMITAWPDNMLNKDDTYEVFEQRINQFINENKTMIKNLFLDADRWTLDVLFEAINSVLCSGEDKVINMQENPKEVVISNFYIGGMVYYMRWQVKNDFPQNIGIMSPQLYEVMKTFQGWLT